jgi:hypothetical protein
LLGYIQKRAKVWYPYILRSCGVHNRNISSITQGSHLGFHHANHHWFLDLVGVLNIYYHPSGCRLKDKPTNVWSCLPLPPSGYRQETLGYTQKWNQSLVSLHFNVMWSPLQKHF